MEDGGDDTLLTGSGPHCSILGSMEQGRSFGVQLLYQKLLEQQLMQHDTVGHQQQLQRELQLLLHQQQLLQRHLLQQLLQQ